MLEEDLELVHRPIAESGHRDLGVVEDVDIRVVEGSLTPWALRGRRGDAPWGIAAEVGDEGGPAGMGFS